MTNDNLQKPGVIQSPSGGVIVMINPFTPAQWPTIRQELCDLTDLIETVVADFDVVEHLNGWDK